MVQYFNLGTSPYREQERKELVKCCFPSSIAYSCSKIAPKEYKYPSASGTVRILNHFSLEERRDYGTREGDTVLLS
jgi:hypothetical protein